MSGAPRSVSDDSVPRLPRGVRLVDSPAQGGMVLLAPERVFKPDAIAIEILKRCDGKAAVGAIVDDLARTFAAEPAQVAGDVRAFLQDLADKGMVTL